MKSHSNPSPYGQSKNQSESSSTTISSTKPVAWLWERRDEQGKLIDHQIWLERPSLDLEVWNATLTPLYPGEPIRPTKKVNDSTKFVYGL
jgi:hypothetical protein